MLLPIIPKNSTKLLNKTSSDSLLSLLPTVPTVGTESKAASNPHVVISNKNNKNIINIENNKNITIKNNNKNINKNKNKNSFVTQALLPHHKFELNLGNKDSLLGCMINNDKNCCIPI